MFAKYLGESIMNTRVFTGRTVNIFIAGLITGIFVASAFATVFLLSEAYHQGQTHALSANVTSGKTPGEVPESWLTLPAP